MYSRILILTLLLMSSILFSWHHWSVYLDRSAAFPAVEDDALVLARHPEDHLALEIHSAVAPHFDGQLYPLHMPFSEVSLTLVEGFLARNQEAMTRLIRLHQKDDTQWRVRDPDLRHHSRQPGILGDEATSGMSSDLLLDWSGSLAVYGAFRESELGKHDEMRQALMLSADLRDLALHNPSAEMLNNTRHWRFRLLSLLAFHRSKALPVEDALALVPDTMLLRKALSTAMYTRLRDIEAEVKKMGRSSSVFQPISRDRECLLLVRRLYGFYNGDRMREPLLNKVPPSDWFQITPHRYRFDPRWLRDELERMMVETGLEMVLQDATRLIVVLGPDAPSHVVAARADAIDRLGLVNPFDGRRYRLDAEGRLLMLPSGHRWTAWLGPREDLHEKWGDWIALPAHPVKNARIEH
ncbi:hypothetical protein SCOR_13200 [Sulfidibacter corallicola]|uniref:Uncharacterized protein n=1 Tax=Sulfidibacter corallicola TaxID=2818388 RepID=A0A8A4TG73_SULCO|nr:hypothetical protein [Sulfidibacter corallicola]QTD47718.1 hypothetical protein J3U87_19180 [Sulfidibacter corallicola]